MSEPARSVKHSTTKVSPLVVNVWRSELGQDKAPVAAGNVVADVVDEVVVVDAEALMLLLDGRIDVEFPA